MKLASRHENDSAPSRAAAVAQARRSSTATAVSTGIDASPRMLAQRRTIESLFGAQAAVPSSPPQRRELPGAYAAARAALAPEIARETPAGMGPVQRLTGAYDEAGKLIAAYSPDSYDKWAARLQEAEDLGFAAPTLAGHASKRPGTDGKGEKNRQQQNNTRLEKWWTEFEKWKRKNKKDDDEDEDGASGGAVTTSSSGSGQRSESHRDTYKQQRKTEKREAYESKSTYVYVPPWNGGPSAWTSNRTGD